MAGFFIAMISGALMSIQGVFNTDVTKSSSIWVASGFVQLTALVVCVIMWLVTGRPEIGGIIKTEPKIALLGGVLGAFITYTVVKSIEFMGTANAILVVVITQIAVAYLIEIFGLFGSKKCEFSWMRLGGLVLAIAGVAVFELCDRK